MNGVENMNDESSAGRGVSTPREGTEISDVYLHHEYLLTGSRC